MKGEHELDYKFSRGIAIVSSYYQELSVALPYIIHYARVKHM